MMNSLLAHHDNTRGHFEAEVRASAATTRILRVDLDRDIDHLKEPSQEYWLDLCLTPRPRNIQAGYPDYWGEHRFERLGEVFLIPPGEAFLARCDHVDPTKSPTQTSIVCSLKASVMDEWCDGLDWSEKTLVASLDIPDRSIRGLMMRLARETANPGFGGQTMVDLIACQLAIELARHFTSAIDYAMRGGLSTTRLRLIEERVRQPGRAPTLEELADLCGLSVRHLSRAFRVSRGCSIGSFVEQCRLETAKQLLLTGEPIKGIASTLGYASPSSFTYAFRRATGATPGQYRRKL